MKTTNIYVSRDELYAAYKMAVLLGSLKITGMRMDDKTNQYQLYIQYQYPFTLYYYGGLVCSNRDR